ncbi:MAG: FRG domain-containing protein [Bacteroidetes bacterium]|nr:FRG domain-containing protein [Bacteroidota bacterium]
MSNVNEFEITNIEDFFSVCIKHDFLYKNWIHRGQNQIIQGQLLPTIGRGETSLATNVNESQFLSMFKRVLPLHNIRAGLMDIDYLAMGQHYKLKTRLVDWSLSPFIALYFACDNVTLKENKEAPAVVYSCLVNEPMWKPDTGSFNEIELLSEIKWYVPDFIDNRIYNQRGAFTIHPFNKQDNKYIGIDWNSVIVSEYITMKIPHGYISSFKLSLEKIGFSPLIIYNTLDASAEYANNWALDYQSPPWKKTS